MKPALALALFLIATASAQTTTPQFTDPANLRGERPTPRTGRELPIDTGSSGLAQLLRRLNTRASILNIVAHPDDEDGGMLTLYSRGFGARVADLSLTRGEGGQNAMTGDFEDALGLLRTQELLSNDRYVGVTQMFGTEVDFGFSKTKEEAFAKWTHDRVLYDAVRAIRLFRPLVITATFIGGVTDGHGQHQVSGQIAQEAFKAAADPTIFPDQIAEGLLPWQALRVYARVPQGAITGQGLYDYATGQYTPAKFTNYVTGEVTTTTPSADVIVHEGATDPLLTPASANPADLPASLTNSNPSTPLSYVQFARIGLGLQRSQIGPGVRNAPSGAFDVPYHLYGSAPPTPTARPSTAQGNALGTTPHEAARAEGPTPSPAPIPDPNFFTGIDTSIAGIASVTPSIPKPILEQLLKLDLSISAATRLFDQKNPAAIAPQLADALTTADRAISQVDAGDLPALDKANILHELRIKRVQLNDALALALGLTLDPTTSLADQTAGTGVIVLARLTTTSATPLTIQNEWLQNAQSSPDPPTTLTPRELQMQAQQAFNGSGAAAPDAPGHATIPNLTSDRPVTRSLHAQPRDTSIPTRPYFSRDSIETPVYTLRNPDLRNAPSGPPAFTARAIVQYRGVPIQLASVVHDGAQPLQIVPPVNLSLSPHAQVLIRYREPGFTVDATILRTSIDSDKTLPRVHLDMPAGWKSKEPYPRSDGHLEFLVIPPDGSDGPLGKITASATINGIAYSEGYRCIGYGDLPRTNYFTPATDRIVRSDLKRPSLPHETIGYLPGTGDDIPAALTSIGMNAPTILTVADLTPTNLAKYDTVILGVRTYNAHPDLHGAPTQALLDYARNGGNVVVQYQSPEFTAADAPFPLSLGSNEKVVDETAPIQLLDPHAALLTTPNKITSADFNNWIEERGHGFLSTWDPHYTALTETHDPNQSPQRGGLITTPLGKGRWTYCAFALYRQLPEAVPGAFRLFINLLNP